MGQGSRFALFQKETKGLGDYCHCLSNKQGVTCWDSLMGIQLVTQHNESDWSLYNRSDWSLYNAGVDTHCCCNAS